MKTEGFTMVELLVASAAALLVVAMMSSLYPTHARAFAAGRDTQELRATLRRVADGIAREIRGLGFDPIDDPSDPSGFDGASDGLAVAEAARIEVRSDLHGASPGTAPDDRLDWGSSERVSFHRSTSTQGILQAIGGFASPLCDAVVVREGGLRFRYLDACGDELVPPAGASLAIAERRRVAAVEVTLSAEHEASRRSETVVGRTALRNRLALRCPVAGP